jgi:hypothetical protein
MRVAFHPCTPSLSAPYTLESRTWQSSELRMEMAPPYEPVWSERPECRTWTRWNTAKCEPSLAWKARPVMWPGGDVAHLDVRLALDGDGVDEGGTALVAVGVGVAGVVADVHDPGHPFELAVTEDVPSGAFGDGHVVAGH